MFITGNAFISEIDDISKKLKRITEGDASIEYHHGGYTNSMDDEIIKNEVTAPYNPYYVTGFLETMGGSRINLARGLTIHDEE